jgi:transcriptional regulator
LNTSKKPPSRPSPAPDLIPGTLELLILKAVMSMRKSHGYEIAEWLHSASGDSLKVEEGALYPALHRLELRGLLEAEWGISHTNRRVKFYRLTRAGRKHLAAERRHWNLLWASVMRVLESN